jgi:Tfp pilus assembly protein PilP
MFARFMIPLAISLAFGVLFASVITLLIVPCATVILEDVQLYASGTRRRRAAERIAAARSEQETNATGYAAPEWPAGSTRES